VYSQSHMTGHIIVACTYLFIAYGSTLRMAKLLNGGLADLRSASWLVCVYIPQFDED
jgi:hypothetical protein